MQQITAPEILWRIFTLVESNADLARASRLNKFIGAAALDVLWNDIYFSSFLSLFPTHNTPGLFVGTTNKTIITPLSPKHWKKINPYARRVRTLRRSPEINGMEQILTSLKLYDRGSEMPFIFPKLQCLIWNYVPDLKEVPLIANLFLAPTLKEISIKRDQHPMVPIPQVEDVLDEFQTPEPPDEERIEDLTPLLLAPLDILSEGDFSALRKLYLPLPSGSRESLESYHIAVTDLLLHLTKWQLEEVSVILTRDVLHILATFENLYLLELHDLPMSPLNLKSWGLVEDATRFKKLQSLSIRNLRSFASLAYLEYSRCVPSRRMEVSFNFLHAENHLDQHHAFSQLIRLLNSQRMTLETLEVNDGAIDLMEFLEPLLEFPSLKELYLGPGVTFDIRDDTLRLISTKWVNLTHLSIYQNQGRPVSLNGIVPLRHCPIQSLRLSLRLSREDISYWRHQIENSEISPLHSLKSFYLTDFDTVHVSENDVTGAALVLVYLFPNAEFVSVGPVIRVSRPGTPSRSDYGGIPADDFLQKVLQIRKVILELLGTFDISRLTGLLKSTNGRLPYLSPF